jgi:hypothetical protein
MRLSCDSLSVHYGNSRPCRNWQGRCSSVWETCASAIFRKNDYLENPRELPRRLPHGPTMGHELQLPPIQQERCLSKHVMSLLEYAKFDSVQGRIAWCHVLSQSCAEWWSRVSFIGYRLFVFACFQLTVIRQGCRNILLGNQIYLSKFATHNDPVGSEIVTVGCTAVCIKSQQMKEEDRRRHDFCIPSKLMKLPPCIYLGNRSARCNKPIISLQCCRSLSAAPSLDRCIYIPDYWFTIVLVC